MAGHTRRQPQQQLQQQRIYQARSQQHRNFNNSTNSSIHCQLHQPYQQARGGSPSFSLTICYSYLIAIFSSFLVVLGIYLSLTRFNARFLYISLAGLLIETLGASLYCITNIRKSKSAQHKQRRTDDFNILNNETTSQADPVSISTSSQRLPLSRQQQARTVTHILTNRTLNQSAIVQENGRTRNNGNDNPINIINGSGEQASNGENRSNTNNLTNNSNNDNQQCDNQGDNQSVVTNSSTGVLLHQNNLVQRQEDMTINNQQLPNSEQLTRQDVADNSSINPPSRQFHELPKQQQPHHNETAGPSQPDNSAQSHSRLSAQPSIGSKNPLTAIEDNDLISERTMAPLNAVSLRIGEQTDATEAIQPAKLENPSMSSQATSPSSSATSNRIRKSRQPNLRRTLVMGLGGEEEMVEIDEEVIDKMSVLPPSYDSIVKDHTVGEQQQQHEQSSQ